MREAARKGERRTIAGRRRAGRIRMQRAERGLLPCLGRNIGGGVGAVASARAHGPDPRGLAILVDVARQVARGERWELDARAALHRAVRAGVGAGGGVWFRSGALPSRSATPHTEREKEERSDTSSPESSESHAVRVRSDVLTVPDPFPVQDAFVAKLEPQPASNRDGA
jgi:hypothetical protein